jgi:hypothetical protein
MKQASFLEKLASTLEDPTLFGTDEYVDFLEETKAFLKGMQTKLLSQDPLEKQEALYEILEMKKIVVEKKKALIERSGLAPETIEQLA